MPKSKTYISSSEDSEAEEKPKKKQKANKKPAAKASASDDGDEKMFPLAKMRFASVSVFRGKKYVNIREYYQDDDGEMKPGRKGIALNEDQWENLKKHMSSIDDAIENA